LHGIQDLDGLVRGHGSSSAFRFQNMYPPQRAGE
jgi:hypothetical protein